MRKPLSIGPQPFASMSDANKATRAILYRYGLKRPVTEEEDTRALSLDVNSCKASFSMSNSAFAAFCGATGSCECPGASLRAPSAAPASRIICGKG